ncbi:hypothetical protein TNCV_2463881 [Trichonephila clavipes]|nr:hypothetical protein TNCV_2463881 [Trichonephila clavipes]
MPWRRNRRQYEQLSDFEKGPVVGIREAGCVRGRISGHLSRRNLKHNCMRGSGNRKNGHVLTKMSLKLVRPPSRHTVLSRETIGRRLADAVMNPDSVSMLMTSAYECGGGQATVSIRNLLPKGIRRLRMPDLSPIVHIPDVFGSQLVSSRNTGEFYCPVAKVMA